MIASILFKMKQGGYIGEQEYNEQLNSHFSWEKPSAVIDNTDPNKNVEEEEFGPSEGNDV